MIDEEYVLSFLDDEINFFAESKPPLRYRFLCWLCGIRPRADTVIDELEFIQTYITTLAHTQDIPEEEEGDWYTIDEKDPGVSYG